MASVLTGAPGRGSVVSPREIYHGKFEKWTLPRRRRVSSQLPAKRVRY